MYLFVIFFFVILPVTRKNTDEEMGFFLGRLYDKSYLTEIGSQIAITIVFYLFSFLWSLLLFAVGFHLLWTFALLIEVVGKWIYSNKYNQEREEDKV